MEQTLNSDGLKRDLTNFWMISRLRAVRRNEAGPAAVAILVVGLLAAIALDGNIPVLWSRVLFGVLFLTDLVAIDWLTRER